MVSAEQLGELGSQGYDAVINLLPGSSEHAVVDEASIVADQGIDYVHIPVEFDAPTHDDLEQFTAAMDDHESQLVHVHCAANFRVSAFYGLYALNKGLCTAEEADALVQGLWNPADYPAWASFISDGRARPGSER